MRRSAFVLVSVFVVACATSAPPPAHPPEPSLHVPTLASASSSVAPRESAPVLPDVPNAVSWKDPDVIKRLAADCRWKPSNLDKVSLDGERNVMSCMLEVEQSCAPDPCFEGQESKCKPACTKACGSCAGSCASSCESCKSTCKDEACKLACAGTCADCRDACVKDVDRCQTGTCGAEYAACRKAMTAEQKKPACRQACPRATKCAARCEGNDSEACYDACQKVFGATCDERLFPLCAAGGGM